MPANNFPGLLSSQRRLRGGDSRLPLLELCSNDLSEVGRQFYARNWVPATSGNFSMRLDRMAMLITRSGVSKGDLTKDDIVRMGLDGRSLNTAVGAASAETPLHCMIYQRDPEARSVLHTHSLAGSVLSMLGGDELRSAGMEIQKAFPDVDTHSGEISLPIFNNTQDMDALAVQINQALDDGLKCYNGFLIRGHGLYAWGDSIESARRHIEAWEFLMESELLIRQLSAGKSARQSS